MKVSETNMINAKKPMPRNIIKPLKTNDKQKILKAAREKWNNICVTGVSIELRQISYQNQESSGLKAVG